MKNSKLRRILLTLACAVLLVSLSVGATLAYLTDETKKVENTFTVGNVSFDLQSGLDEAEVDEYGENPTGERVQSNEYKIIPNHTYIKDPTAHLADNSEDAYIRVFVTINKKAVLDTLFAKYDYDLEKVLLGTSANWKYVEVVEDDDADTRTYELRYIPIVKGGTSTDPVFTHVYIPGELTNDEVKSLEGLDISVIAYAIQADGFDDTDDAWDTYDAE